MTDFELVKRCADKMGLDLHSDQSEEIRYYGRGGTYLYNPLIDNAQAMALAKRFMLIVDFFAKYAAAPVSCKEDIRIYFDGESETANRAIVECVARMP